MYVAIRDRLIFFNPKNRVLHHFIYETKCVTGYPGLRMNSAFPFLLCTSLRDDRLSFLYLFSCGNQHFRLDLWVNILQPLMKSSPFFCLTDVAGPAVFATHCKFSFCCLSQQQTSTWRKYGNWSHSSATPKTSQTHTPPPWPPHAPLTCWDLHGPPPCSQARWDRHTLSTHHLIKSLLPPATWESIASSHITDPLSLSENTAYRCDYRLQI